MRFGYSLYRQQATVALLVGRSLANAFVVSPRCGFAATTNVINNHSTSRRWLHAQPTVGQHRQQQHHTTVAAAATRSPYLAQSCFKTITNNTNINKRCRPSSGRPLMMSSLTGGIPGEEICRAAHILCAGEDAAEAALTRIKNGEQFGDVASDISSCPSKEKGGDLGWFKKGQMVADFEAACFGEEPGTIVKVQSQFGWHVVAILSKAILPRQMAVDELGEILEQVKTGCGEAESKYQFVDVREESELAQANLPGFINLPLSKFEEWGDKLSGENAVIDAEKNVIVMCHHGMRSNQMAQHLATKAGFKKVWNVEGGLDAYAKQVDSSIRVY